MELLEVGRPRGSARSGKSSGERLRSERARLWPRACDRGRSASERERGWGPASIGKSRHGWCAALVLAVIAAATPSAQTSLAVPGRANANASIAADGDIVVVAWGASLLEQAVKLKPDLEDAKKDLRRLKTT